MHLYTLAQTPLAWLPVPGCSDQGIGTGAGLPFNTPSQPEIVLTSIDAANEPTVWAWNSKLIAAGPFQQAFTLDDARFSRVARNSDNTLQYDYDGDAGNTIRFGDGVFGLNPQEGAAFTVTYRVAVGARANVAADSITEFDPGLPLDLIAVTNPLPATSGADAETLDSVRRLAPAAFRAVQFRAVLPNDYVAAAETQPWVQRAGCTFRWTGSWLTVFTTPDPLNSETVTVEERLGLVELLNRYRLAGYESYVPDPQYVSIDLVVEVCAQTTAFRGDVESGLLKALSTTGFFSPDNFSFGQPLERSRLEAAIDLVPGIDGVLCIEVRVRGRSLQFQQMGDQVTVGVDQIIRCDNDPSRPERGALKLVVMGGK
jgi:predicted phage baseplate assembly protein